LNTKLATFAVKFGIFRTFALQFLSMQLLNFASYAFQVKETMPGSQKYTIFDPIRKKQVALTPEEWVRQHVIQYLLIDKQTPKALIGIEVRLMLNDLQKRADLVVYSRTNAAPLLLIECKAPHITITQSVFEQIARYNMVLKVPYLMVTNGITHHFCYIDFENQNYTFLTDLPIYDQL
jgi:hypothetical protein